MPFETVLAHRRVISLTAYCLACHFAVPVRSPLSLKSYGGSHLAKVAASSWFANVSDEEIAELNISAVPKSTQYTTRYGVKIFKSKTASLNLLFYFETVQKAKVSTAGAEIVNM